MTDQLPEVSLTLLQEARAWKLYQRHQDGNPYDGMKDFARLIVHLLDELAKPAHEREPPHCSSCSCGMPAEPPDGDRHDAARYRWMKEHARKETACDRWEGVMWNVYGIHDPNEIGLDAVIDKARGATETTEGGQK